MWYDFLPFQVLMACAATLVFLNAVGLIGATVAWIQAKARKIRAEAQLLELHAIRHPKQD
jgi:hypothetical protein